MLNIFPESTRKVTAEHFFWNILYFTVRFIVDFGLFSQIVSHITIFFYFFKERLISFFRTAKSASKIESTFSEREG